MGFSNTVCNNLLDHFFGKATYTPPTAFYVAFSTTDPLGDGSGITEQTALARVATTAANWNAAVTLTTTNATALVTTAATATTGVLSFAALYDAATAGNFLGGGAVLNPQSVALGNKAEFDIGTLTVKFVN